MDGAEYSAAHTSNDLLFSLQLDQARKPLNYEIIVQNADEVQDIENAPVISMGPYLIESQQARLLTTISIYTLRGESREQVRLLYMNAAALRIWRAMGKQPKIIGALHRPPKEASLSYGVPFSEGKILKGTTHKSENSCSRAASEI
jgi:hypothetical protein